MNYLVVIPARGGSKGIPRKNIKKLGDKPLIHYTIDSALEVFPATSIWVNTEDNEIKEISLVKGINVFNRPDYLAGDEVPTIDVLLQMIESLQEEEKHYDAVLLLQATYPFRYSGFIAEGIKKFEESNADSLISVRPVPHQYNPHWVFESTGSFLQIATGDQTIISRRQDLPEAYHRDGALYIVKVDTMKTLKTFIGNKLSYIVSDIDSYVNIDNPEDWETAEEILRKRDN